MVFPITYFGPIPYFQELLRHPHIALECKEKFPKQTWRNRMAILTANGVLTLSVPCKKPKGKNTLTDEILIDYDASWQKDHWGAIESAYRHAPFFFYYGEFIHDLIFQEYQSLLDLNLSITKQIYQWLDCQLNYSLTEDYQDIQEKAHDMRIRFSAKSFHYDQSRYIQVFSDQRPFQPNLSVLDLIMNEGPLARKYLL